MEAPTPTGGVEASDTLAGFAEYDVALRGGWTEYHRSKRRWQGVLTLPASGFLVALMPPVAGGAWYEKSRRLVPCDYDATLEEDHSLEDRHRLMLLGEATIDVRAYYGLGGEAHWRRASFFGLHRFLAPDAGFLDVPPELRFKTGRPIVWRSGAGAGSGLRLLVLAAGDVATKRCGIWGIKRRRRGSLPDAWRPVLARSRRGLAEV